MLNASHRPNRRVANDAIRKYIHAIDIDAEEVSGTLFSCSKRELEMEPSGNVQLGLDANEHHGKKRLRGVVIDEKVVFLLKESERPSDEHDVVNGVSGLNVCIV